LDHTLLKSTDSTTYTGHEFEHRKVPNPAQVEVMLDEETFEIEVIAYGYEYMAEIKDGEPQPLLHDPYMHPGASYWSNHPMSRRGYEDVDRLGNIQTVTHEHERQEGEPEGIWEQILRYLKDDELPAKCSEAPK
jgi:hypothetical protein